MPEDEETVVRRLHVSGLMNTISASDLRSRFTPFGEVLQLDLKPGGPDKDFRGFSYVTLKTTGSALRRCLSVYKHTKWRGMQLRVELAKPDFLERLKKEWADSSAAAQNPPQESKRRSNIRKRKSEAILSEDMSLVKDNEAVARPGWKLGRYGRATAVVRMRAIPGRKLIRLDPTKKKENLVKLGTNPSLERSVFQLSWSGISETCEAAKISFEESAGQQRTQRDASRTSSTDRNRDHSLNRRQAASKAAGPDEDDFFDREASLAGNIGSPILQTNSIHSLIHKNEDDLVGVDVEDTASDKLAEERRETMSILRNLLGMRDTTEDERARHAGARWVEPERYDPDMETDSVEKLDAPMADMQDQSELATTGSAGISRNELNVSVVSASSPSPIATSYKLSATPDKDGNEPRKTFTTNTDLRALVFGTVAPAMISNSLRSLFATKNEQGNVMASGELGPGLGGDEIRSLAGVGPSGVVGKSSQSFSLLSALGVTNEKVDEEEADSGLDVVIAQNTDEGGQVELEGTAAATFALPGLPTMFFFHIGNQNLLQRSVYKDEKIFMRTKSIEEVKSEWESRQVQLTAEFKRKHKSASKKRAKMAASKKKRMRN
ncbi:hypothetical protein DFJ73DRAFT_815818 [Zopfochytrium polystomum]|nr:hypothetical protein DFJ73DRAFT_815818 [Zopfochytrium polystomum]